MTRADGPGGGPRRGPQGRRRRGDREGRRHPRRALHPDRPGQGGRHPGHARRLRRRRQRRPRPGSRRPTPSRPSGSRTSRSKTIQFVTPGLLGWAVAMSAAFGAAATLQGWRQTQAAAPAPALAGARAHDRGAARVVVTIADRAGADGDLRRPRDGRVRAAADRVVVDVRSRCWCWARCASCRWGCSPERSPRPPEGAVNLANFLVLPMAFLSGSFFPLERIARRGCRPVSCCCRCATSTTAMLDVMVRGEGPVAVAARRWDPAAFAVVMTALAARLFRWEAD